jgi:D-glycero-D-manno-heptose 1,7-bisphosphate phosphatase
LNRAIFFDRDGVLNKLIKRDGGFYSPQSFDQFEIYETAKFIINELKQKGFLSIVVSNQPDVARGNLKKSELDKMTKVLINKLMVDDVFYCTHDDSDGCNCRKPAPGLIIKAAEKWRIDLQNSFMVGDTWKDAEAAKNVKVNFMLLNRDSNSNFHCSNRIDNLKDIFKYVEG